MKEIPNTRKTLSSIEGRLSGKQFPTEVIPIYWEEIKNIHKKDGWFFNWKKEYKLHGRQLYKLVLVEQNTIQGLLSIEPKINDLFIELHLIETAPHNYGRRKKFLGVPANLVAFACKLSFEMGFDGCISFKAKTQLKKHYADTLGAQDLGLDNRMSIFTDEAKKLVNSYYSNFFKKE